MFSMTPWRAALALVILPAGALAAGEASIPGAGVASPVAAAAPFSGGDPAISPGADFFAFANGAWIRDTPIPADRSSYGVSEQLQELADQRTADLIRAAAASGKAGADARRVGDYFASYLDQDAIDARGLAPIRPALDAIAAIGDRTALASALGGSMRADVDVLNATAIHTPNVLGLWVAQDLDDPGRYVPFLLQGGLGMPDRDYYLKDTPHMAELRARYREHIATVLALAGFDDAKARGDAVYELEARIAKVHTSRADTEDVTKGDNHWTRERFEHDAPGLKHIAAVG